jgi:tetratricopeptide (TPR) repeat protein
MLKAGSLVFSPPEGPVDLRNWSQWWTFLRGANWRHPYGPKSDINVLDHHPVVHVSFSDALAYAGLADSYNRLSDFDVLPSGESFPKAAAAATKALELDNNLAEAHTSLGTVKLFYEWDRTGAEREFRQAIEINPGYSDAHETYAYYLSAMGRFDEALAEIRHARELDPLSISKITGDGEILR